MRGNARTIPGQNSTDAVAVVERLDGTLLTGLNEVLGKYRVELALAAAQDRKRIIAKLVKEMVHLHIAPGFDSFSAAEFHIRAVGAASFAACQITTQLTNESEEDLVQELAQGELELWRARSWARHFSGSHPGAVSAILCKRLAA